MLRDKTFAPEFCSLISDWFDMREQAPGANLLHVSVSGESSLVVCLQPVFSQRVTSTPGLRRVFSHRERLVPFSFRLNNVLLIIPAEISREKNVTDCQQSSSLVCTKICLLWNNVSPVGQSNWLIFLVPMPQSGCFIIQLPHGVLRVYWLGYLPRSVFRERVSGASSLVWLAFTVLFYCLKQCLDNGDKHMQCTLYTMSWNILY